jgi:hypothetical protein
MKTLLNFSSYRLIGVAGSVIILSSAVSIAAVLAWSPILIGSHSIAPAPSMVPAPIVDSKAFTTTLAPPISNPLEENMDMLALLDLHRYARNGILSQGYKITVRLEDGSHRVSQKTVWNLSD